MTALPWAKHSLGDLLRKIVGLVDRGQTKRALERAYYTWEDK